MVDLDYLHREVISAKKALRKQVRKDFHSPPYIKRIYLSAFRAGDITLTIEYTIGEGKTFPTIHLFNVAL